MKRLRTAMLGAAVLLSATASSASATIITPTTNADDFTTNGDCTLREAIQAANSDAAVDACATGSGADVIQLGDGPYDLTISGAGENSNATGDLDVTAQVTIQGNGSTVIDAHSIDRAIDVSANAPTTIQKLTVTNGAAKPGSLFGGSGEAGGGIRSLSPLTLSAVSVTSSHAGSATHSVIVTTGFAGGDGGAIWANQTVSIIGGSFVGDQAGNGSAGQNGTSGASAGSDGTPGGDGGNGGSGGAVAVAGGQQLTATDTTFSSDAAGAGGAGGDGGNGAPGQGANPEINGGNGANGGNGGNGGTGGAVMASGPAMLRNISASDTHAGAGGHAGGAGKGGTGPHNGGSGSNGDGGFGGSGGALAEGAGTLTLSGSTLSGASAGAGGAGHQVESGNVAQSAAGAGGSGGAVSGGTINVDHTLISASQAGTGGTAPSSFGDAVGGSGGGGGGIDATNVRVSDTTITTSSAGGGGAGQGVQQDNPNPGNGGPGGSGGGVHAAGTITLANVTLDHNHAGAGGAGGKTGASWVVDGGVGGAGGGVAADGVGTISNTTFEADSAGNGGPAGSNGTGGHGGDGGGVRALSAGSTVRHVTVAASTVGAGGTGGGTAGAGGGISGPAAISSSVAVANTAAQCAGTSDGGGNVSFPDSSCGGVNGDPKLGPLADNGGPTKTQLPGPGSAALDISGSCSGSDQRGVPRPQGPACDSGAVETANPALSADGGDLGPVSQGGSVTKTITVHATFDPLHPLVSLSSSDFSIVSDGCSGTALAPAATCAVQVKLAGSAALGPRTATLHLTHDAAGPPLDVPLSGTVIDTAPPVLSGLSLSHKTFRAAKTKAPKGTTIRFTLSEAATVKFTVSQKLPGRRNGKRCVAPTKKLRHAKRCTRLVTVGSFTRNAAAGANSVPFNGRVNGPKLKPGSYTLTLSPTDASGNHGTAGEVGFKVVKR